MADTYETTADIIAWLRRPIEGENAYLTLWRDEIAARIEAAHRRERGDCAKLREALAYLFTLIDMRRLVLDCNETEEISAVQVMLDECRAALDAPPRNCDKYATADEALKAQEQMFNDSNFANGECKLGCPECDNPRVGCKIAWLYAPTTEQEGGNNGNT